MIDNINCDPPVMGELGISCLLYADDLVLLSRTKEGLQKSINTLYRYTEEWFLEINQTKTKYLVFSQGRKSGLSHGFKLNGSCIQACDSYCYLGVIFTRSGSFKSASKALNDKATSAMFSLIRNLYKHRSVDINIMLDLFDKMILPIAQYGCEVWGTNYIPNNSNNNMFFNQSNLSKHITETLHYNYMKMLLGVPKRTSNWAVTTETGRYPIIIRTMKAMIKYLFHLSGSPSPLIKATLSTSMALADIGKNSWFKIITRVLKFCELDYLLFTNDTVEIDYQIKNLDKRLKQIFINKWSEERVGYTVDSKLDLFVSLKDNYEMSKYLLSRINPHYKLAISKIRLSAHKLPIETERYSNTPRVDRTCPLGCQAIGDEYHYLFICLHPSISKVYMPIHNNLKILIPEFDNIDIKEQFKLVLNSSDHSILNLTGKLCLKIQAVFKEITW